MSATERAQSLASVLTFNDDLLMVALTFATRLTAALKQLSAEELAAPSPMRLPHGEQTLLDALRFVVWHETLHLGQISMLRSHHGLTPPATLAIERAALAEASVR